MTSRHSALTGRPSGNQEDSVDNRGKSLDSSIHDGDDEGGGRSLGSSVLRETNRHDRPSQPIRSVLPKETMITRQKTVVVVRNEETDDKDRKDVEEKNSVEDSSDGLGDGLSRVGGFSNSDGDDLSSDVRERSYQTRMVVSQ